MALFDTQLAMLANLGSNYLCSGKVPGRMGNAHQNIVPYQVFEASDGHLILAVGNDRQFAKFCEIAGRPDWAADERFATNAARVRHRDQLVPQIEAAVRQRPRAEWLSALEAAKVPCGAINNIAEALADPQAEARGSTVALPHPLTDRLRLIASPMKLSATPVQYRHAPPLLGQHSRELLAAAGLSGDAIEALIASGVVGAA
jgi:crotonobetainyl-CoA:carnitine CoA-transferase CaiB-like acyl-CoA transferase